jgi:hypothetical protein
MPESISYHEISMLCIALHKHCVGTQLETLAMKMVIASTGILTGTLTDDEFVELIPVPKTYAGHEINPVMEAEILRLYKAQGGKSRIPGIKLVKIRLGLSLTDAKKVVDEIVATHSKSL